MPQLPAIKAVLQSLGRAVMIGVVAFALVACGDPSKAEILAKAKNVDTRAQLEAALGRPDDISKLGPVETWTYNASDGSVVFIVTGDTVALQATGGKSK